MAPSGPDYDTESDPLFIPDTRVLRNLLDIDDQDVLDQAELALFLLRSDEPLPSGNLDAAHYLRIHHHLFQDIYAWAGQMRTIRVAKGGNWFCYPEHIEKKLFRAFAEYGDPRQAAAASTREFAERTAHLLAEINAIHPFREGNGRTQLVFLSLLAVTAGYELDDTALDPETVLAAMIESFRGDETRLVALILAYIGNPQA